VSSERWSRPITLACHCNAQFGLLTLTARIAHTIKIRSRSLKKWNDFAGCVHAKWRVHSCSFARHFLFEVWRAVGRHAHTHIRTHARTQRSRIGTTLEAWMFLRVLLRYNDRRHAMCWPLIHRFSSYLTISHCCHVDIFEDSNLKRDAGGM